MFSVLTPTICQTMLSHYFPFMLAAYCAFGILHQNKGKSYGYKVALFVDLWLCALIFRDPDITISLMTRLYMMRAKPPYWARGLNWFLNLLQPGHCEIARLSDIARAQNAAVGNAIALMTSAMQAQQATIAAYNAANPTAPIATQ